MTDNIITSVANIGEFQKILSANPGLVLLKMGAEWCGPCKRIHAEVAAGISQMPKSVQVVVVDIDESIELYSYLKTRKRVNGIPALLAWKKGNVSDIPDDVVLGADKTQVNGFFSRCLSFAKSL
jgi:thiol-disulfide isomerase/thioredoxin